MPDSVSRGRVAVFDENITPFSVLMTPEAELARLRQVLLIAAEQLWQDGERL